MQEVIFLPNELIFQILARMFTGCDNNIPLRHRAMFIVSMPYGMGGLINVGKKFLGPVKKRIHVISNSTSLLEACNGLLNNPEIIPTDILGYVIFYLTLSMKTKKCIDAFVSNQS